MRSDFETWISGLTDDDGSGTTGDLLNISFFNTQMGIIDDAINTTGGLITTDTTYYVATTGSDVTGDGSVTTPWATPAYALNQLGNYRVQDGKTLTIQCDDGTYTFTSPITNLPKGFLLTGKNTYAKTMSSVQSSSGSAGAWSVVVNLNNVTSITTSDYAIFSAASGGSNPKYIEGFWDITAVDAVNNRITVSTTHRGASAPSSTVTATVTIIKTNFSFTGCSGVALTRQAGGILKNVGLHGDNTGSTNGIDLTQASLFTTAIGIRNFGGVGVLLSAGSLYAGQILAISSSGNQGIYATHGGRFFTDATAKIITGNASYGLYALQKSGINCTASTISGNANYGIICLQQSFVDVASGNINANTTFDVYAASYSYINAVSATIAGSISPAANTQGNEYGYIDT